MAVLRVLIVFIGLATAALAQGTGISISPTSVDSSQPVEVTADSLTVEQSTNSAVFTGNAKVVQGDLVLSANSIMVRYNQEQSAIDLVEASDNLLDWTPSGEVLEDSDMQLHVRDMLSVSEAPRRFMRLRVERSMEPEEGGQ